MIHSNHIDGRWVEGAPTSNINPSDINDVVGRFVHADADQARTAVEAARDAAPSWAALPGAARAEILFRAGTEIVARADELGDLLAREEGKTRAEAIAEVRRAAAIVTYHAGEAVRNPGEYLPSVRPGVEVLVGREPVGVVSVITPWNFPMAIPAWKIAPALAHGNTVVFKPADAVPASAWQLVDILVRAGIPPGVLNLVMGRGSVIGDVLTGHPAIDAVSFTGSAATGAAVRAAATAHGARVQLEMGGKNPLVVHEDADIESAVIGALDGAYGSTGQRCTASSRLVVHERIHDRFVDALISRTREVVVGDSRAAGTTMGPVIDADQLDQDQRYLHIGVSEGATLVGGDRVERSTPGFYMEPALLLETAASDTVNREEIFGPVASVIRVGDLDEAIAVANDSEFGLTAGIYTTSLTASTRFRREARAGMVMVNLPTAGVDYHVPFGGRGASSYGPREQGRDARDFYTTTKTTYIHAE